MANPKNPVRAARQAGRQQIRAAKDARKVAKIESRVAGKVAKISGTTAKPAAKTSTYKPSAPTVKLPAAPKPTIKMTDTRSKMLDMPASTRKTTPAKKKGLSESEKNIIKMWKDRGYTYGKDGKVRNAQGQTPEEVEAQRVKDMFLQPGETRQNTSPFASREVAAKRALKDALDKVPFGKKKSGGSVKRKK